MYDKSDQMPTEWFANSPAITKIRSQIQQGIRVPECTRCHSQEDNNLISWRVRRNMTGAVYPGIYFKESLIQSPAYKRMTQVEFNELKPSFLHISLSNICNLACRMCGPSLSTKLGTLLIKSKLLPSNTEILQDWTRDTNRWNDFCDNLVLKNNNLICLHFMGGEPMISDKFFKILQHCVDNDRTDFHVTFVTNGTIWDDNYVKIFSKFKSVAIEVSIENCHPTNDYVRVGSNFKEIESNIKSMLKSKSDNMTVVLRTVPQALTIIHYDTIIDFALENNLNIDYNPIVNHPKLEIVVLPKILREQIIKKLTTKYSDILESIKDLQFIDNVSNIRSISQYKKQLGMHIKEIISILEKPEPLNIEQLQQEFVDYNSKLDSTTGFNFQEFFPELAEIYEKYNRN